MRKFSLALSLLLIFALQTFAQVKANKRSIRRATSEEVQRYQLNEEQAQLMAEIQEQRLTNLAAIEDLRQRDYERYLIKSRNIRRYVDQATLRLLSDRQVPVFEALQRERAREREALLRQLKEKNATPAEREQAMLRLEESWQ